MVTTDSLRMRFRSERSMPRRTSILIHTLAVAIISALAWWHHDPALVLAYVSGALIEWEMTT